MTTAASNGRSPLGELKQYGLRDRRCGVCLAALLSVIACGELEGGKTALPDDRAGDSSVLHSAPDLAVSRGNDQPALLTRSSAAMDDLDGDRYPNAFEQAKDTNPVDAASFPASDFIVDPARASESTTDNLYADLQDAVAAATARGQQNVIIGFRAGTYKGSRNRSLSLASNRPTMLIIGLDGAGSTIIDGEDSASSWTFSQKVAVASLTFRNYRDAPLQFSAATASGSRVVDVLIHRCTASADGAFLVNRATDVELVSSTIFDNRPGVASAPALRVRGRGALTARNTIVWNPALGAEVSLEANANAAAHFSLVRGDVLSGSGNVVGVTDPRLRSDGHLFAGSPARRKGSVDASVLVDMDLETRAGATVDVGVDEFVDSDADELSDWWERQTTGSLSVLTAAVQDADGDGLSNLDEFSGFTDPGNADSDGDGMNDGAERAAGADPNRPDTDADGMPDGFEATHRLNVLVDDAFADADGDRYPNIFEWAKGTNPRSLASSPAADAVVDLLRGNESASDAVFDDLSGALAYVRANTPGHRIIGMRAGRYIGNRNDTLLVPSDGVNFLLIGIDGASSTVIDAQHDQGRFSLRAPTVVSSLTLANFVDEAVSITAQSSRSRLVNVVLENARYVDRALVVVNDATGVVIENSTFVGARGGVAESSAVELTRGAQAALVNNLFWNPGLDLEVKVATESAVSASNNLARGDGLPGATNVVGVVDPGMRGARLLPHSPARGRGVARGDSGLDMDLDARATWDVGADQWTDMDADGIEDVWERAFAGGTSVYGAQTDADADGLRDVDEYLWGANPTLRDTDGDGVEDGAEVAYGLDPARSDLLSLDTDLNQDGVDDSVGLNLGIDYHNQDVDGDGVSNATERELGLDPWNADTDDDGVADAVDAFPRDPSVSQLPPIAGDTRPPQIQILQPLHARPL